MYLRQKLPSGNKVFDNLLIVCLHTSVCFKIISLLEAVVSLYIRFILFRV